VQNLLELDRTTVWRIKKRYLKYGLETALAEDSRPGQPLKYNAVHQAQLTALVCGSVPAGRIRWTIRLLVEELNKQKGFETITYGSVRDFLKKTNLSLG
jgi:putative transposase